MHTNCKWIFGSFFLCACNRVCSVAFAFNFALLKSYGRKKRTKIEKNEKQLKSWTPPSACIFSSSVCEQSGVEVKRRWCQIYRMRNSAKTNGVYIIALVLRIINFFLRFFHGLLRTKGFRYAMPVVSEMGRCETETAPKLYCRHRLIGTRMHEMWNGIHLKNYDGNDEGDGKSAHRRKRNRKKTIFFLLVAKTVLPNSACVCVKWWRRKSKIMWNLWVWCAEIEIDGSVQDANKRWPHSHHTDYDWKIDSSIYEQIDANGTKSTLAN